MEPVRVTRRCPRCGAQTDYVYHRLHYKLLNSTPADPMTFWDGVQLIVMGDWERLVGRKFRCLHCGKRWRTH